jgi:pantetheine-phosphate adenylyltransferase
VTRSAVRVVCPGSFDPVTNGHLDVISRAARLYDEVVVAVGINVSKSRLFTADERMEMLEQACAGFTNVEVAGFSGLLTDFCRQRSAQAIVKGLRTGDFDYELQMAQMNARLAPEVETVFLPTSPELAYLASSLVKEVASLGGDVTGLLPEPVRLRLLARLDERRSADG